MKLLFYFILCEQTNDKQTKHSNQRENLNICYKLFFHFEIKKKKFAPPEKKLNKILVFKFPVPNCSLRLCGKAEVKKVAFCNFWCSSACLRRRRPQPRPRPPLPPRFRRKTLTNFQNLTYFIDLFFSLNQISLLQNNRIKNGRKEKKLKLSLSFSFSLFSSSCHKSRIMSLTTSKKLV